MARLSSGYNLDQEGLGVRIKALREHDEEKWKLIEVSMALVPTTSSG